MGGWVARVVTGCIAPVMPNVLTYLQSSWNKENINYFTILYEVDIIGIFNFFIVDSVYESVDDVRLKLYQIKNIKDCIFLII